MPTAQLYTVSIHAPVRARQLQTLLGNQDEVVSIHAPVRARPTINLYEYASKVVSIHAPVRARPYRLSREGNTS